MFDFMNASQIAALVIGVLFSILSVATTCLAIKYSKKFNTFLKAISMTLTAPFIAGTAWLYLVLNFVEGLRKDEALTLVISLLLSLFVFGMVVIVAKALYSKHREELEAENNETEVEHETINEEKTSNKGPYLLNGEKRGENAQLPYTTKKQENNEDLQKEERVKIEETQTEEVKEEIEESKELVEENSKPSEESLDENKKQDDEVESEEETSDEDKEFEEFLDSLRRKLENNDEGTEN